METILTRVPIHPCFARLESGRTLPTARTLLGAAKATNTRLHFELLPAKIRLERVRLLDEQARAPDHQVRPQHGRRGRDRRRSVGLKRAWRALFDRQTSSSAEVEFGSDFPLSQIIELVNKEAGQSDAELFRLVNRADRSRYEEPNRALLTDEEFELFKHIDSEHRRLWARVAV